MLSTVQILPDSPSGRTQLVDLRAKLLARHNALVDESFTAYDAYPEPATWPSSAAPARRVYLERLHGRLHRLSRAIDGIEALFDLDARGEMS